MADEVSLENVKKIIEIFLNELKTEEFTLFQNRPTVEVFFKGGKFVGVSIIDEYNEEINCLLNNNPRAGKVYLYFPIEQLSDDHSLPFLGKINTYRLLEQIKAKNAYNINLKRVDNLLEDAHYSVALVFLVSAFENVSKDLFFLHHELPRVLLPYHVIPYREQDIIELVESKNYIKKGHADPLLTNCNVVHAATFYDFNRYGGILYAYQYAELVRQNILVGANG